VPPTRKQQEKRYADSLSQPRFCNASAAFMRRSRTFRPSAVFVASAHCVSLAGDWIRANTAIICPPGSPRSV